MNNAVRPLCIECKTKPRAYAYRKGDKIYWRRLCDTCNRKKNNKKVGGITALQRSGYKKKRKCELCGFKAQNPIQLDVFFVDGNLRNTTFTNLKTVCANCTKILYKEGFKWKQGDLVPDF